MKTRLQEALDSFGPSGEEWIKGTVINGKGNCAWSVCVGNEMAMYLVRKAGFLTYPELWEWNDAPERTFEDIRKLFQKAIRECPTP